MIGGRLILVLGSLVVVAAAAWVFLLDRAGGLLEDLAERTRAAVIRVEGGRFVAGNFEVDVLLPDGTVERRPLSASAVPPYEVEVADFALLAHEPTLADVRLFLAATGRPEEPPVYPDDHPASLTWQEAVAYCEWLGEIAGFPMRLPTEAEWEFAARSRGALVPWATSDGTYRYGVTHAGVEVSFEPVSQWPPSPMGFHDMVEGRTEWVSDEGPDDTRISKGGSSQSDSFYETIPGRTVTAPFTGPAPILSEERVASSGGFPVHFGGATARCAADAADLPDGVGTSPDLSAVRLPDVVGPYDAEGNYLGD